MNTQKNFFEIYRHSGTRPPKVRQPCDREIYAKQKFAALLSVSVANAGHIPRACLWLFNTS
jgi:hypothetical protein